MIVNGRVILSIIKMEHLDLDVDPSFSQNYSSGPITALSVVFHQKVIAGCGNQLLIYDLENLRLETRKEVLEGASVHGICNGPAKEIEQHLLCVYGAKEVCIVCIKKLGCVGSELNILTPVFRVYDWIWEARWLKEEGKNECIALALAHNSVVLWHWEGGRIASIRHCVEDCILYCAHFIGDTWDTLVLAAGTVFNQVVLWSIGGSEEKNENEALPVIHTLSGHKGVIFSIRYHTEHKRLCSVSDDRSIQIWQLSFPGSTTTSPTVEDWKSMKSVLLFSLFGHSARVWNAVLLKECFASIGEDATCFVWNYDGKIISKFKGHKGRSIWSIAATEDENVLLTGGGDSSVRKWEIHADCSWSSAQHTIDIPKDFSLVDGDFPRVVTLLSFDTALVMMNSGIFLSHCLEEGIWRCLFNDRRFVSYSVVSHCPDKNKVAVGSITGVVKLLSITGCPSTDVPQVEQILFDSKVMGIVWITDESLLVSGPEGKCVILTVTEESVSSRTSLQITSNLNLFLPPSIHRWITAACSIQLQSKQMLVCGDKNGSIHCYLYPHIDLKSMTEEDPVVVQPSQTFQRVHGKTGVTSVHVKDGLVYSTGRDGCYRQWETKEEEKLTLRHSVKVTKGFEWIDRLEWCGDDMLVYGFLSSSFVVWSVSRNQQVVSVQCGGGHRSWGCCHENGALRFTFLKAGNISVVDSKQCNKQSLIKAPLHGRGLCDGRFIKLIATRDESPAFLVGTASEDTTVNVGVLSGREELMKWTPLLNLKGHLSSVRCLALSHSCVEEASNKTLNDRPEAVAKLSKNYVMFTGGGRAEIRVWKLCLSDEKQSACGNPIAGTALSSSIDDTQQSLNSQIHISGEPESNNSTDNDHFKDEGEVSVNCTYEELSTHFLGESRHKNRYSNWKAKKLHLDPETRVMSLAATPLTSLSSHLISQEDTQCDEIQASLEYLHIISTAGSDGVLRVFSYNSLTRILHRLTHSSIHKGCVLKVMHFLTNKDDSNPAFYLFSTSTNGCIVMWSLLDIVEDLVKTFQKKKQRKAIGGMAKGHLASSAKTSHSASDSEDEPDDMDNDYVDFTQSPGKLESDARDWLPICQLKTHQSGINSISVCHFKNNSIFLASGGDDNALTVQVIDLKDTNCTVLSKVTKPDAHAAQITGVWLVSSSIVVSVSIDQRICVWKLNTEGSNLKLSLIKCKYIHIADISSMDVYLHRDAIYLLISGEGLCLYSFK